MRWLVTLIAVTLLAACAGPQFTVDDGRAVNEELLGNIRSYGAGERALRPAIARSAELKDPDCATQWELPFSVATSYNWNKDDRVAWVRALGVDERLTVIGATGDSPLHPGDKIQALDGYKSENTEKMLLELADLRDAGTSFSVTLWGGRKARVTPFKVCRGYTRFAPPNTPHAQDYHWRMSLHPLEVAGADLTEDEALWTVLWTQGVSEEGGLRMKAYHYGTETVSLLYNLFTIASGIKTAAVAAEAAMQAAKSAAASVATELVKAQLVEQAKSAAMAKVREELGNAAQTLTRQQVMNAMQQAAVNRGSLAGVARIAATAFDEADAWAYARMEKLNANPLAAFSLHQKLLERGRTANSMALDQERLTALSGIAEKKGRGDDVVALLQGIRPSDLQFELTDMPLASNAAAFSYDDVTEVASNQPFAHGLVEGLMSMPLESATASR